MIVNDIVKSPEGGQYLIMSTYGSLIHLRPLSTGQDMYIATRKLDEYTLILSAGMSFSDFMQQKKDEELLLLI